MRNLRFLELFWDYPDRFLGPSFGIFVIRPKKDLHFLG